jgi:hypothetical protein
MQHQVVQTIAERLRGNLSLALEEGGLFFERRGSVWATARRMAETLEQRGVCYAVLGGLAAFHHGYRCYGETIEILVSSTGFGQIDNELPGFYRLPATTRKFIDKETGVSVRFFVGESRAGSIGNTTILYPPPAGVREFDDGVYFVDLATLLNVKLARGCEELPLSREIADVQEIIKSLCLTEGLAAQLHPAVRPAFISICRDIDAGAGPFLLLWELPVDIPAPPSLEELIAVAEDSERLKAMHRDGVQLYHARPRYENSVVLTTNDRSLARKYDMHHESEYLFND